MGSLNDIVFEEFYFEPKDDIVQEFFIPALKRSERYDRATGYFTSFGLIEMSVGVCDLASRNGKIRVITSPRLSPEDVQAIKSGYDMKMVIGQSMVESFETPTDLMSLDRLSLLSELIATGILEMKIAVMKDLDNYPNAIFHPKFGIMYDSSDGKVSFTGSMNETRNGLGGNWDHIEVSNSNQDVRRTLRLEAIFEELWAGKDDTIRIMDMPDVVQDLIHGFRKEESMLNLDKLLLEKYSNTKGESVYFKSPGWLVQNKRQYQEDAIEAWVQNGYNGIFNMATGTGKTKTALRALERLYNANPDCGIFTIIIAPQKHLVDQWAEEVKAFDVTPIIGHSDANTKWKDRFRRQMMLYLKEPRNGCLVITISSFSSKEIQEWIQKIKHLAIVVDEAHNMGSSNRLKKLPQNALYRLALSATLERYKDEFGTRHLREYFGEECINLPIEEVIGKYLTNYNYYPIVCNYSSHEYFKFVDSNERLDAILKSSASIAIKKTAKKEYVQYSYTLNAKMESKFETLRALMDGIDQKDHFLIYCGKVKTDDEGDFDDGDHQEYLNAIDKASKIVGMGGLGFKISRITYKEDASRRKEIISEFDSGETAGIVAISCLDEGIDIPSIQTAIIMSSSDNPREYVQRRGRVLRLYDGKDHADIYDFIVVPRDLNDVYFDDPHAGLELKMISKEIRRMLVFSSVSLNPEETDNVLRRTC